MFIPIGFGSFLRKFPVALLLLSFAIGAYSSWYFPKLKSIDADFKTRKTLLLKQHSLLIEDVKKKKPLYGWSGKIESSKHYPGYKKAHDQYKLDISKAFSSHTIANPLKLTALSLLHSTFLHADWSHLIGNLALLLLVGAWIEQRLGRFHTLGIFFSGSFTGLAVDVLVNQSNIIGASAGVFAILGAFLALFYHTQMRFLFVMFPFIHKLTLPTLWTFPFIFFTSEFLALGNKSNVAHLAHVVGAISGFAYAYYHRIDNNLRSDQLFKPEVRFERLLKNAQTSKEAWRVFHTIMLWNPQNETAVKAFLKKSKDMGFQPTPKQKKILESNLLFTTSLIFKNGTDSEIRDWIFLLPDNIEHANVLKSVPLKQLLTHADYMAQNEKWSEATILYIACLNKKPSKKTSRNIETALTVIERLSKEYTDEYCA